jgi:hypothetical protein
MKEIKMTHSMTKKILDLFENIHNDTMEERLDLLKSCVLAGEWNIAIEDLCSNLYEFNIYVTQNTYQTIYEIIAELKIDNKYLKMIQHLVSV